MPFMSENNKLALMAIEESIDKIQRFTSDLSSWQDLKPEFDSKIGIQIVIKIC
jgi:hypothetical protein